MAAKKILPAHRKSRVERSDLIGDGRGDPAEAQMRLSERWAEGGSAVSIVREVGRDHLFAVQPGHQVSHASPDPTT